MDAALASFAEKAAAHVRRCAETGVDGVVEVEYRVACTRAQFEQHVARLTKLFGEPVARVDTVLYCRGGPSKTSPVRCIVDDTGEVNGMDIKTELYTSVFGTAVVDGTAVPLVGKCCLEERVPEAFRGCFSKAATKFEPPPRFTRTATDAPDDAFMTRHLAELKFLPAGVHKGRARQWLLLPGCVAGTHFAFGSVTMWRVEAGVVGAGNDGDECDSAIIQQAKRRERLTFTDGASNFHVDCTVFHLQERSDGRPRFNIEVEMRSGNDLCFPDVLRFLIE